MHRRLLASVVGSALLAPLVASAQPAPTPAAPGATPPPEASLLPVRLAPPRFDGNRVLDPVGLVVSGYVQAQLENSQLSEDQLQQGGVALNRDRFVLRRGRIRLDGAWRWASFAIEVDGSTTRGLFFGLRRAEASLLWRNPRAGAPPWAMLTAGLTEIPFGYELSAGVRSRLFMERSLASLAFFRGEPDVGARLSGGLGWFRYAVAVMNGTPLDDRAGSTYVEPTGAMDVIGRVGLDATPHERFRVSGGVSFLTGTGFHAGTDATPNGVIWRDLNENSVIDGAELTAQPGSAATPSLTFRHWAVNADLQLALRTRLGWTRLYGELSLASNLDRAVYPADPIAAGADVRQLGAYVAFSQEVTRYGVVGFRWDYYDANSDFLDSRRGRFVPASLVVQTFSPVVGVVLPDRAKLLFQYDAIVDSLARDQRGVPTDLRNDQWTLRLQMEI
ncbi:MAG: phosphate-selective porin [Myxococcaceae bacterium]|nr:phosphate-selective porin [Myxococcaceae bacterium]